MFVLRKKRSASNGPLVMGFLQNLRKTGNPPDKSDEIKELPEWAKDEISQLQSQLLAKKSTIKHLEDQLNHVNEYYVNEYSSLWSQTARELETKVDELTAGLHQRDKQLDKHKSQIKVLDGRLDQANKLLAARSDDLSKVTINANMQEETIKLLENKIAAHVALSRMPHQELQEAKTQIDGQNRKINQLINESAYKTSQILNTIMK